MPAAGASEPRYLVPMLGHALRVVEAVAGGEGLTLQAIVDRAHVSKSSAFRILFTLVDAGWVERDPEGRYHLGQRPFTLLSADVLAQRRRARVRVEMEGLRDRFGETVNLAALRGEAATYVEILDGTHALRLSARAGSEAPLHASAVGKAILASLPAGPRERALRPLRFERFTSRTLRSRAALVRELAQVARQGHAFDDGETEAGALCIAVALPEAALGAPAALSLSGPAERMRLRQPEILDALAKARDRLAQA